MFLASLLAEALAKNFRPKTSPQKVLDDFMLKSFGVSFLTPQQKIRHWQKFGMNIGEKQ